MVGLVGLLASSCVIDEPEQSSEATSALDVTPTPTPTVEETIKGIVDRAVGPRTDTAGNRRFVGMSVIVIKDGIRHRYHYGEAVLGSGIAPDGNTLYAIGSVTKTFTATLLALYDHRNIVKLGTKLADVTSYTLAPGRDQITLEQLATHHSGLQEDPPGGEYAYRTGTYGGDMSKLMGTLGTCTDNPCNDPIPAGFPALYSNYGYAVLAHVLSRKYSSTASVQQALTAEVMGPLGLSDTSNKAHLTESACVVGTCTYGDYGECTYAAACNKTFSARAAIGYQKDQTMRDPDEGSDDNVKAGSGVVWSTPYDMTDWLAYNMGLGGSAVPQELQDILPVIQTVRIDGSALAWEQKSTPAGHTVLAKAGVLPSFKAHVAFTADRKIGVMVMKNSENAEDRKVGDIAYDIIDDLSP
ncbi:MAG TPA: serine hydrolase domain-containing protein [Kofleriaceae bacterium]|nr:serine hydrolase domain-containing protein [Kofleriaceae bacterium]